MSGKNKGGREVRKVKQIAKAKVAKAGTDVAKLDRNASCRTASKGSPRLSTASARKETPWPSSIPPPRRIRTDALLRPCEGAMRCDGAGHLRAMRGPTLPESCRP